MNELTVGYSSRSQIRMNQRAVPLAYAVLFTVAELILQNGGAAQGVIAHCIILVSLLLQTAINANDKVRVLCISLALVPATRLVSAGLTLGYFGPLGEEVIIQVAWLVATLQVIHYLHLNRAQLGFCAPEHPAFVYPLAAATALVIGFVSQTILQPWLKVNMLTLPTGLLMSGLAMAVAGLEVLVFCGLLLRAIRQLVGESLGVILVAVVWGIFRFGTFPWPYALMASVEGLWLAWLSTRTRSIGPAIVAHAITLIIFYGTAALVGS